ncbi:MAG: anthranilate phosphoribosyltransferase [Clostridia bacterium]|nr:anthranilate phosphoribosyltransferase [Clostridia bacterium]
MMKQAISELVEGKDLGYEKTKQVMNEIMDGKATDAQIAAFITAFRIKGETIEEITACAEVMRAKGIKLNKNNLDVFEIVGTGGDKAGTFNISTTSAFVIAGAGIPVAKHGNRSVSSKSGAADVLEMLGANIKLTPEQTESVLQNTNMCFMFAPTYHSSMRFAAPARRETGIRSVFNVLGPLTSPAAAEYQLMGVYSDELVEPLARVLHNLGLKRGAVVCGASKLDEMTITGSNLVCEINHGEFTTYTVNASDYELTSAIEQDIVGGTPEENAQITLDILSGQKGAKRDMVVLNAGMSLYLAGAANTIKDGIHLAQETIDSGKAKAKLDEFVKATQTFAE